MTPRSTIRLQFNGDFTLDDAAAIVPYLAELGISHIYASPIFAARSGSTHGYDVTDPTCINPALGGPEALTRLTDKLHAHDMGLIIDIVPNHMAASHENRWWFDVLENGSKSQFAKFFDINWRVADPRLRHRLLIPILGAPLTECLDKNEISLAYDPARRRLVFRYYDHLLPLSPASYGHAFGLLGEPFLTLARTWFPPGQERALDLHQMTDGLAALRDEQGSSFGPAFEALQKRAATDRDFLTPLLSQQHYVLAPWSEAARHINWRRFFDISDLVALRMERAEVFNASHVLIRQLFQDGLIDGVRLDHVDGLADPKSYCRRLRRELKQLGSKRPNGPQSPYIIVEKILETDENLPTTWQIDGTTGYDFMADVVGILHDPAGEAELTALWTDMSGDGRDFAAIATDARLEILRSLFPRQLEDLVDLFLSAERRRATTPAQEATRNGLRLLLAYFTRYRLYGEAQGLPAEDQQVLASYQRRAAIDLGDGDQQAVEAICRQMRDASKATPRALEALTRFQQLSATLAAKAGEDTAFYRYGRLLSRNDVGSNPAQLSLSIDRFHAANQRRQRLFPSAMLATATHDHKRGEDVRCRLAVLSEDAPYWTDQAKRWLQSHQAGYATVPAPVKLMIYQMIVGTWSPDLQASDRTGLERLSGRLAVWLQKSLREAKQETSWAQPDADYEAGCQRFLSTILDPDTTGPFLTEIADYVRRISAAAALNGLTQVALRMTCAGIPDLYQGCDFWDFSMVDPDNRSTVNYAQREQTLKMPTTLEELLPAWRNGHVKQRLIQSLLRLRGERRELFDRGRYLPLALSGPHADRLVAFARHLDDESLIVLAPRLSLPLLRHAADPSIPGDTWRGTFIHLPQLLESKVLTNALTSQSCTFKGNALPVEQLLERFPLCILFQGHRLGEAAEEEP